MKHLRYLLLAALVAMPLTACDEDDDPVIEETVYGTVTGTVSAEGTGLAGVAVTLVGATQQSASTGSGGTYTFTNVEAGSYGIAIDASSHPDVSFPVTSKTTNIVAQGETKTVDFTEGSYIRTAAIVGTVTADGAPLSGVAVTVSGGPDNITDNNVTDAAGSFAATGLRAGDYTVEIDDSGLEGVEFASTSASVTVTTGGTKTANFPGNVTQMAMINGVVLVDNQGQAGVAVDLIMGGAVIAETESGAGGAFTFGNLMPGSYTVTITAPEDVTFNDLSKTKDLVEGETWNVNFAGFSPAEPATVSIKSITFNDEGTVVPVDLDNVYDQIEVTLNITRNDQTLRYVDIVFTDPGELPGPEDDESVIVATQVFEAAAAGAEMATSDIEETTLSIQTTQLMPGTTPTFDGEHVAWVPAIQNGKWELSANLVVAEEEEPIPTNKKVIVVQNYDVFLAGTAFGGDLEFFPKTPDMMATGDDGETWYAGGATTRGWQFIAYSGITPEDAEFDLQYYDWEGYYNEYSPDDVEIIGDAESGILLVNHYDLTGVEADEIEVQWDDVDNLDYGDDPVGPDGTMVDYWDDEIASIGAIYYLSDPQDQVGPRRYIILPDDVQDGQISDPGDLNFDNVGPTVYVDGEVDMPASDELVAFKDEFDQPWINADYVFLRYDADDDEYLEEGDVIAMDHGVGLDDAMTSALWYDWEADTPFCTDVPLVTGDDLTETEASDGTPDGHQICATATDWLGNASKSGPSNVFGVDKEAPEIREYDEAGDGTADFAPELADINGMIYSNVAGVDADGYESEGAPGYDTDWYWGFEALDGRSGFDTDYYYDAAQHALTGEGIYPAFQSLLHFPGDGTDPLECTDFTNELDEIGAGVQWVRSATTDFTCLGDLAEPGYFWYENQVTDRAGNTATLGAALYAVDDDTNGAGTSTPPTFDLLGFASTFYNPGVPADFELWATDDLEVIEAEINLVHPSILGDLTVFYGFNAIDDFHRFDGITPVADPFDIDEFDPTFFSSSVIGQTVSTPLPVFGRLDFTCTGGGAPYAECLEADGVTDDATEYNLTLDDDFSMLPTAASGTVQDVGFNTTDLAAAIDFIPAQWENATAAPWSTLAPGTSEVIIRRWYIDEVNAGEDYTATMEAPTSIEVPFFDAVALVNNDGGDIAICGFFTYDGDTDNGVDRFFNYSASVAEGSVCDGAAGTWHAVGFKGAGFAGLVTQGVGGP